MVVKIIKFYQKVFSPFLGANCRFEPSCSTYSIMAVEKYGVLLGFIKTFWRILRCNPLSKGGVDIP